MPDDKPVDYSAWDARWDALMAACTKHRAYCPRWRAYPDLRKGLPPLFNKQPPASEAKVRDVEAQLGFGIPSSFRRVLTGYASALSIAWQLPDDGEPSDSLPDIYAGELFWDLHNLPALEKRRSEWARNVFPDPNRAYDRVWYRKLAFKVEPDDGNLVTIDLEFDDGPVVYVDHEDGPYHGWLLGRNFEDYVDRMSLVGCPLEYVFSKREDEYPDPYSKEARNWRAWFGLNVVPDEQLA
jgi:hypothetical protein